MTDPWMEEIFTSCLILQKVQTFRWSEQLWWQKRSRCEPGYSRELTGSLEPALAVAEREEGPHYSAGATPLGPH